MNGKIKKILAILFIIVIIGAIGYFSYRHFNKEKITEEESEDVKLQKIEQVVSEMASKYNAVTNLGDVFSKKEFLEEVYTIEFQNNILQTDGRPILFYASLDDIWKEDGQYYVRFENFWYDINFELKCNEEQVKSLLEKPGVEMYVVVAQIEKVYKEKFPDIIAKGRVDFDIYIEENFIVTGECLDFLYFEDVPLQLLWK